MTDITSITKEKKPLSVSTKMSSLIVIPLNHNTSHPLHIKMCRKKYFLECESSGEINLHCIACSKTLLGHKHIFWVFQSPIILLLSVSLEHLKNHLRLQAYSNLNLYIGRNLRGKKLID